MIVVEPQIMLAGYALGLFFGIASSLIGFIINSAFRWMGF